MRRANATRVKASYFPLSKVPIHTIRKMYDVYSKYYENISFDVFIHDLEEKNGVFLIEDRKEARLVGFSTLKIMDMEVEGRTITGVFSGDTIVEEAYWGTRALQFQFFVRMVKEKLKRPFRPLFWLLISKGYKTYLLLANNFHRYYPDPSGRHDTLAPLVDAYCQRLFPEYYCPDRKLLDFGDGYTHLKSNVASITDDMRRRNEKIHFFEQCNPSWYRGTELPCIGQVSASLLFSYPFALWRKLRGKSKTAMASVACD